MISEAMEPGEDLTNKVLAIIIRGAPTERHGSLTLVVYHRKALPFTRITRRQARQILLIACLCRQEIRRRSNHFHHTSWNSGSTKNHPPCSEASRLNHHCPKLLALANDALESRAYVVTVVFCHGGAGPGRKVVDVVQGVEWDRPSRLIRRRIARTTRLRSQGVRERCPRVGGGGTDTWSTVDIVYRWRREPMSSAFVPAPGQISDFNQKRRDSPINCVVVSRRGSGVHGSDLGAVSELQEQAILGIVKLVTLTVSP